MLLIDDDDDTVLAGLGERARRSSPAYQSPLMMNSGSIAGWLLDSEDDWAFIADKLEALAGVHAEEAPFLYAVGEGNHSLATAKAVWDEYKRVHAGESGLEDHPARWALVEIENLYDTGIAFEPIHRALFNTTIDEATAILSPLPGARLLPVDRGNDGLAALVKDTGAAKTRLGLIAGNRRILLETDAPGIATAALQPLLDAFIAETAEKARAAGSGNADKGRQPFIDYIHGEKELFRLAGEQNRPAVGILLPPVRKDGLFETVARSGPLPRKSFSMGEACEKRFYLECRRVFG
jgi:hypothetical protein